MTEERWQALMNDPNGRVTKEELAEGWHWCWDWDDLLVGPGMEEQKFCTCKIREQTERGFQVPNSLPKDESMATSSEQTTISCLWPIAFACMFLACIALQVDGCYKDQEIEAKERTIRELQRQIEVVK